MTRNGQKTREMTPDENFRELYKRFAQLNDKVTALLNPAWGSEIGILPADHPLYRGEGSTSFDREQDAADEDAQTLRWARRESLLVLLTRFQRGRPLTEDEARTLREHVETEMREAETARATVERMKRTNRMVNGGARQSRERAERAEAALDRVRALHREEHGCCAHCTRADAVPYPCPTISALDGAESAPAVTEGTDTEHLGGGANAEDCPACTGTNPPYPFVCPGPAASRI